jgi:hypothetical protein
MADDGWKFHKTSQGSKRAGLFLNRPGGPIVNSSVRPHTFVGALVLEADEHWSQIRYASNLTRSELFRPRRPTRKCRVIPERIVGLFFDLTRDHKTWRGAVDVTTDKNG